MTYVYLALAIGFGMYLEYWLRLATLYVIKRFAIKRYMAELEKFRAAGGTIINGGNENESLGIGADLMDIPEDKYN